METTKLSETPTVIEGAEGIAAPSAAIAPVMAPEPLVTLAPERRRALLARGRLSLAQAFPAVDAIIADVRARGDAALREYTQRFDHAQLDEIVVSEDEIEAAYAEADPTLIAALEQAAAAITATHRAQLPTLRQPTVETAPGVRVWREWRPLARVGLYAPGGGARYPSTVLMTAIPARVAGCGEIILCTPPGPDGRVPAALLVAARIAGVTRVCAVGGAQAIAALAYGTASVPRVDKIVGPGNSYVAAAKLRVAAQVAIDLPAGPSEILIVADETAQPEWVAADLLAQAEHGPDSACVAVVTDAALAASVQAALADQLATLPTRDVIRASLAAHGALLLAISREEALAFANDYAAEHLTLAVRAPEEALAQIDHAGSVFLGNWSAVAAGDFATGGNHTLPTAGFARSYGPLAVEAYGRWMQAQQVTRDGLASILATVDRLAQAEGLPAHAASAQARFASPHPGLAPTGLRLSLPRTAGEGHGGVLAASAVPAASDASDAASAVGADATVGAANGATIDTANGAATGATTGAATGGEALAGEPLRLHANEAPWEPPQRVLWAIAEAAQRVNRYPDPQQTELRAALAAYSGVAPDQVIAGNGSDEILRLIALMALGPGDEALLCEPTFGVYRAETRLAGATVVDAPLDDEYLIRRTATLDAITPHTRLAWLCSPNNPTGTPCDLSLAPELLARGLWVVVDEAYAAFSAPATLPALAESPRLIIVRTLSKSGALAGARLGYALAAPATIAQLDAIRQPYNVNALAQAATLALLAEPEWIAAQALAITRERDRMAAALASLPGVRVWPSAANFSLVQTPLADAAPLQRALAARGALTRHFPTDRLRHSLRVSVGRPAENDRLVALFAETLAALQDA